MLFEDEEEGDDDKSDEDSADSEVTFDFEAFCKGLDDDGGESSGPMTHEEKMSMATVDEKFSKGSVEVARGKRMTLMPNSKDKKKETRRKTIIKEVKKRQTVLKARSKKALNETDSNSPSDEIVLISRGSF